MQEHHLALRLAHRHVVVATLRAAGPPAGSARGSAWRRASGAQPGGCGMYSTTAQAMEGHRRCWCRARSHPGSSRLRCVAWCRMLAVSTISTMKVDWPAWISSLAPMRVKMRSTRPMRAEVGGHETAHLRHEHDQRHLAQEGAFAAHVRPGEDADALAALKNRVVGDKALPRSRSARPPGGGLRDFKHIFFYHFRTMYTRPGRPLRPSEASTSTSPRSGRVQQ